MKILTIIYKSGVVVEMSCRDYSTNVWGAIKLEDPAPWPIGGMGRNGLDMDEIAEVYEGRITGAHDNSSEDGLLHRRGFYTPDP
jgi:hypothetical protein